MLHRPQLGFWISPARRCPINFSSVGSALTVGLWIWGSTVRMGHVRDKLRHRRRHHRFSPSRTQRQGGRSAFVNSDRTDGRIRTGPSPFDAPKRRNDDGMCHVARSTCRRVNPYENKRWGKIFEGEIAEIPKLQGKCALVWNMYHVSDDPEGSTLCPQGAISFFSPMPSSSDALGPRVTKYGTQVKTNKGYSPIQILGVQKLGGSKFWIFEILDILKKKPSH